ncbi:hypothetical protein EXS74_03245 [Candidatus Woesearchaeota archaeon]|nr:hypothetical protein [Candidatus Woesearchaeota archaeon]
MKIMNISVLLFLLLTMSACSTPTSNVSVEIPFEMKVGETASIEGHEFTFLEVRSDSRCPIEAVCIWEGEATIVLDPVEEDNLVFTEVSLSTKSTEAYTYLFQENTNNTLCSGEEVCPITSQPYTLGYLIQLNSLSPLRSVEKEIDPLEYVATLTIYLSM